MKGRIKMATKSISVQDTILYRLRKQKLPVSIYTTNGFQITNAIIASYDSFVIAVLTGDRQMLVYKHAISSIVLPENFTVNIDMCDDANGGKCNE